MLRTLLGKINKSISPDQVGVIVAKKNFKSLDEVKSLLPEGVNVISV